MPDFSRRCGCSIQTREVLAGPRDLSTGGWPCWSGLVRVSGCVWERPARFNPRSHVSTTFTPTYLHSHGLGPCGPPASASPLKGHQVPQLAGCKGAKAGPHLGQHHHVAEAVDKSLEKKKKKTQPSSKSHHSLLHHPTWHAIKSDATKLGNTLSQGPQQSTTKSPPPPVHHQQSTTNSPPPPPAM
jgi:hypothetical protein